MATATRIVQLTLVTSDLRRALNFYLGLGFVLAGDGSALRLGRQQVALVEDRDAAAYPISRAANDPWFQHFAIAVSDIVAASQLALSLGAEPISQGGPQLLPSNTGSVTAWKFRDPDGHPLEFSHIPNSDWLAKPAEQLCLGIDHTALAVADMAASLTFYRSLGFTEIGHSLNKGPEQDRLDGLTGAVVDIVALGLADGPHLELLRYAAPASSAPPWPAGVAASRTVLAADRPDAGLRDPDGHILDLLGDVSNPRI